MGKLTLFDLEKIVKARAGENPRLLILRAFAKRAFKRLQKNWAKRRLKLLSQRLAKVLMN